MTGHAVAHLVVGPTRHGVVTFAMGLEQSLRRRGDATNLVAVHDWHDLAEAVEGVATSSGVHLNFTDRLFGSTPADAAQRVEAIVRQVNSRVTVTLHDVPQPADGGNHLERIAAYRAVCAAVHGVVANSEHERSLLAESRIVAPDVVVVIPLPLDVGSAPSHRPAVGPPSVGVFGFIYPGKGHDEVLAAMTGLPTAVDFRAVGECSAGHDDLLGELAATAARDGRRFTCTGYVEDDALCGVLHDVTVPVAHHRHVSASGSINTWIAAHRRPLVPANRYTVEHAERHPGTLTPYDDTPQGLRHAIEFALADPESTWTAADTVSGAPSSDTAARYARALDHWHG